MERWRESVKGEYESILSGGDSKDGFFSFSVEKRCRSRSSRAELAGCLAHQRASRQERRLPRFIPAPPPRPPASRLPRIPITSEELPMLTLCCGNRLLRAVIASNDQQIVATESRSNIGFLTVVVMYLSLPERFDSLVSEHMPLRLFRTFI